MFTPCKARRACWKRTASPAIWATGPRARPERITQAMRGAHGDAVVRVVGMDEIGTVNDEDDGIKLLHSGREAGDEVADVAGFDA